tara:strand:- start:1 stop:225 length:225 start_codon:yes stop_codon:yes gene_type:complete
VTGDSGKLPEIGHVQTEWAVTMGRNMQKEWGGYFLPLYVGIQRVSLQLAQKNEQTAQFSETLKWTPKFGQVPKL